MMEIASYPTCASNDPSAQPIDVAVEVRPDLISHNWDPATPVALMILSATGVARSQLMKNGAEEGL